MKNALVVLAFAAASAFAQLPSNAAQETSPAAPKKSEPARTTGSAPSYKDLKFPALKPIPVPNVSTYVLPNGMKLYLLEDHELPLVSGAARIRVGNLFDPADKVGLASVTGTVMRTGGTASRTGDQLDLQLENMAASVESGIEESSGSVSFSALKENADEVMGVFHDILTAPEFRQDKIDLAKSQFRSAISRRNDDAEAITQREFPDIVYGKDTPYGWRIEYATIDRINRADLQNFYQRYFFPSNVMLAVWGDFKTEEMKAKLDKLFAGWTVQQPPVPDFPKITARPAPGIYLATKKDVAQTFLTMGQLGGDFRDKDYAALEIMADILGGGFQSRLMQTIRTKMGDAYDVSANWAAEFDHPGLFEIAVGTKAASTVETIRAILQEVDRIRASEVSEAELKTAKETALNSLVFAYDTKTKTLGRMLTYEYYGYPKDFIQEYQKALAAVTRADVLRVAKQRLDPAKFTIVATGDPEMFGASLQSLGRPVIPIDLTIAPPPKSEESHGDRSSLDLGRQVLARAQKAAGGVEKLASVKDYLQDVEFQLDPGAGGIHVKETERFVAPNYFQQESQLPNGRIVAFTDGKTGWIATPQGVSTLDGVQLKQVLGDLFRLYVRLLLSDAIPGRTVNAIDANTVEISEPGGQSAKLTFNPDTGLPQKTAYETAHGDGPPVLVENDYSEYRDVAGLKIPSKITILQGGRKFADVDVTAVKINSGLKPEDLSRRP